MINLLEETREDLAERGLTFEDVVWIGTPDQEIPIEAFMRLADREYDSGYGSVMVASDLVICGTDWWLERCEYDGSEWWEYKKQPVRPNRVVVAERLLAYDIYSANSTLEEMNRRRDCTDVQEAEVSVPLTAVGQGTIPRYLSKEGVWAVETAKGVEIGGLEYVCGEVTHDGLIYHFHHNASPEHPDHEHTFAGVLQAVLADPEGFSIEGFEDEYSRQERQFLLKFRQRMLEEVNSNKQL